MAGRAAIENSLSSTLAAAHSVRERGGISEEETSMIGGEGRKGTDGNGSSTAAPFHCIAEEFKSRMNENKATTGMTGPNSGYGKTFGK